VAPLFAAIVFNGATICVAPSLVFECEKLFKARLEHLFLSCLAASERQRLAGRTVRGRRNGWP